MKKLALVFLVVSNWTVSLIAEHWIWVGEVTLSPNNYSSAVVDYYPAPSPESIPTKLHVGSGVSSVGLDPGIGLASFL